MSLLFIFDQEYTAMFTFFDTFFSFSFRGEGQKNNSKSLNAQNDENKFDFTYISVKKIFYHND